MNSPVRIFSSDLDGTLIGKPDASLAFKLSWEKLVSEAGEDAPVLIYNTGRLLNHTIEAVEGGFLPDPDYLICGIGTIIYDYKKKEQVAEFSSVLHRGWNLKDVEAVLGEVKGIEKQPKKYQNAFKSSWYLPDATQEQLDQLESDLEARGLDVNVIYSSSLHLDILPRYANKGNALQWLLKSLGLKSSQALVAGDTGNDNSMFHLENVRGVIVENAQPELMLDTISVSTFTASKPFADGVLEGLLHFGVIDEIADVSGEQLDHLQFDPVLRSIIRSDSFRALEDSELELVNEGYEKAIEALRKNITPMGFSACSLDDNILDNTDENYRSIWGRDGSITVLNSLSLDDPEIRDYNYLRERKDVVNAIMNWLESQDSNGDSLLEIPEAGDWMDLFGRSYNVLYDEVLWYYANICHGRMAELLGDYETAGYRLRMSRVIKETINRKFWPSIHSEGRNFADQQYGMGDTQYLLAEITPFSFDWRCDVYANALAGLFNVLSMERARTAFNFMWGVGVNEPNPVTNLYPPVHAGDPRWKPYYTVNLLNLPYHYHNGGVWPFIGAYWVMFINRLGLREIAQRELYRLAQVNRSGIESDWEFNEWVHGKTGRPMGKRYQAWSAAGYIAAYDALRLNRETSLEIG